MHCTILLGLVLFHVLSSYPRPQLQDLLFANNVVCIEQTDKQLLMAIMAQLDYKYDSALVAAKASSELSTFIRILLTLYNQFGPWCTPRAVEERVKRLKKQAKAENHPTSPLCPGQSTKTEAKMQALRAADIEAFRNHSAEKQTATQAAVTTAAETTPTKASKATTTKATPASRAKKGTATRVKKGKGKAVVVADENEPMAESSDAAESSAMVRCKHAFAIKKIN